MTEITSLREALRDELATIRVLNSTIRLAIDEREKAELAVARQDSLRVVRVLLSQLHPSIALPPKKRAAKYSGRIPEGELIP